MTIIQLGDHGPQVGKIHQALVEAGLEVPRQELEAQEFGVGTDEAVREFQSRSVDADGESLAIDGRVGPDTARALFGPGLPDAHYAPAQWFWEKWRTSERVMPVLAWAVDQIGVHEEPMGSNRGPEIDEWTGMVGRPADIAGPSWCAYFVSAAYARAVGGSPFARLGSTYKLGEWARAHGAFVPAGDKLRPGDIFGIMRTRFAGHTGLVCGQAGPDVYTIEGNRSNATRAGRRDPSVFSWVFRPIP